MSIRAEQRTPDLAERPLFGSGDAADLEAVFKALANANRVRILHALHRAGEMSVGELAETVGMSQQALSNQLQRLLDRGMLRARRAGTRIHYRIEDPCLPALLDLAACLVDARCRTDASRPSAGSLPAGG
jgi:DNA-binding transcriptional ArsR family regulator